MENCRLPANAVLEQAAFSARPEQMHRQHTRPAGSEHPAEHDEDEGKIGNGGYLPGFNRIVLYLDFFPDVVAAIVVAEYAFPALSIHHVFDMGVVRVMLDARASSMENYVGDGCRCAFAVLGEPLLFHGKKNTNRQEDRPDRQKNDAG